MFACHEIPEVGVIADMLPESRVIRLGEIAIEFHQGILELEAKLLPSTPCEVLEER